MVAAEGASGRAEESIGPAEQPAVAATSARGILNG